MKRWAQIIGDRVANVVEQETIPEIDGIWIDVTGQPVGPGNGYDGQAFQTFSEPKTASEVYFGMTQEERIAMRELAKTDPIAEDFIVTLNAAMASGQRIDVYAPAVAVGLNYMASKGALDSSTASQLGSSTASQLGSALLN